MSLPFHTTVIVVHSFPRVSGDEPPNGYAIQDKPSFSPRERG